MQRVSFFAAQGQPIPPGKKEGGRRASAPSEKKTELLAAVTAHSRRRDKGQKRRKPLGVS